MHVQEALSKPFHAGAEEREDHEVRDGTETELHTSGGGPSFSSGRWQEVIPGNEHWGKMAASTCSAVTFSTSAYFTSSINGCKFVE